MIKIRNIEMVNNNSSLKVTFLSDTKITEKELDEVLKKIALIQQSHFHDLGCDIDKQQITKLNEHTFQMITQLKPRKDKKIIDWKINELSRKIFQGFPGNKEKV